MDLSYKQNRGFTLVETLVVMTILGILFGLGINAYMQYRKVTTVSTAATNIRDLIKDTRLKALSVSGGDATIQSNWIVAYRVNLRTFPIEAYGLHLGTTSYVPWDPSETYTYTSIVGSADITGLSIGSNTCEYVVFESVNGKMHLYNGSNVAVPNCTLTVEMGGYVRSIVMVSAQNKIEIE